VFLCDIENAEINDSLPVSVIKNKKAGIWLHDFIAPFHTYINAWHSIKPEYADHLVDTDVLILRSKIQVSVFGKISSESSSRITLKENCIKEFTYETNKTKIEAKWLNS
jgi:hypothetical protein